MTMKELIYLDEGGAVCRILTAQKKKVKKNALYKTCTYTKMSLRELKCIYSPPWGAACIAALSDDGEYFSITTQDYSLE